MTAHAYEFERRGSLLTLEGVEYADIANRQASYSSSLAT